jgi:hypothetical protein
LIHLKYDGGKMDNKDIAVKLVSAYLNREEEINTDPVETAEIVARLVRKVEEKLQGIETRDSVVDMAIEIISRKEIDFGSINDNYLDLELAEVYKKNFE